MVEATNCFCVPHKEHEDIVSREILLLISYSMLNVISFVGRSRVNLRERSV